MRIATVASYAVITAGLVVGCSDPCLTADRPANDSTKPSSTPSSESSAKPSPKPSSKPPFKPSFRRWAVISSKEVQQAGLGDLATTDLSKVKDLELVERDQLDAVTRELQLAAVLESQAAASRLKMGRLLKADALMFLSFEEREKIRALKVVVSECICGARLRIEYVPCAGSGPADLSWRCAAIVNETRAHFARGIRQIVGISPFLSKNLLHDYDPLQAGFARLLEGALTAQPDLAVIEIEEARAIGGEMSVAGSTPADRPVPLLVGGEFTVARVAPGKPEEIQFDLNCQGVGDQPRKIHPPPMPLAAAARFVSNDLPREILPRDDVTPSKVVPLEEQARWLTARAAAFSQVGAWKQATELLEAALLLSPEDVGLHVELLANCNRCVCLFDTRFVGKSREVIRPAMPKLIDTYLVYLAHLDYLIRNRRLNRDQALMAVHKLPSSVLQRMYHSSGAFDGSSPEVRDAFQKVTDAEERFIRDVFPQILDLSSQPRKESFAFLPEFGKTYPPEDFHTRWFRVLVDWFVLQKHAGTHRTPENLDYMFRLLTQIVPDRWGTPENLWHFLVCNQSLVYRWGKQKAEEEDNWVAFLNRLAKSKHRMANLYGRFGLLHWKWLKSVSLHRDKHDKPSETLQPLLTEVETWLKDYGAIAAAEPTRNSQVHEGIYFSAEDLRNRILGELKVPEEVAVQGATGRSWTTVPQGPIPHNIVPLLKFEEINLRVRHADGRIVPYQTTAMRNYDNRDGFDHLLACGEHCDALWTKDAVMLFREKGLVEEICRDYGAQFLNLYWDGRSIWIATGRQGIWVMSPAGKVLSKIGPEQGLPPGDEGMLLHVLAPGKVCAAGSFGEHKRGWCAIVEHGQGGTRVNVFHRATHALPADASRKDPELAFVPQFLREYDQGDGAPRQLLVERRSQPEPLAINPATLEVSVLDIQSFPRNLRATERHVNGKGDILVATEQGDVLVTTATGSTVRPVVRPGTVFANGQAWQPLFANPGPEHLDLPVRGSSFLWYRGSIYLLSGLNIGREFRIDPNTFRAEELRWVGTCPLANYWSGSFRPKSWYSVSSHYGLVGGRRDQSGGEPFRFFQFTVVEPEKNNTPPSPQP